jgi:RNA polymerase sigma-70 factor (ECF subfamily)
MTSAVAATSPPSAGELLDHLARQRVKFSSFLRRRLPNEADAEDLLQQGLVRAAEKIHTVRDPAQVDAWFYRLLRRLVADAHEKEAVRSARLDLLRADLDEASPEEVATCGCSLGLLAGLRPAYATMLRRVDMDGEPVGEVARSLELSSNNATVRLHRARKAMRRALLDACGTCAADACVDCSCD